MRSSQHRNWQQRLDEVRCPACGYQLRGLMGVLVRCPECGQSCDRVNELAISRRSWSVTPTYERLMRPAFCFLMMLLVLPVLWAFLPHVDAMYVRAGWITVGGLTAILVATWLVLLFRGALVLPGATGVGHALLLHAILIGYFLLGAATLAGVFGLLVLGADLMNPPWLTLDLPLGLASIAVLLLISAVIVYYLLRLLYRLDTHVGRHCVRHEAQLAAAKEGRGEATKRRRGEGAKG